LFLFIKKTIRHGVVSVFSIKNKEHTDSGRVVSCHPLLPDVGVAGDDGLADAVAQKNHIPLF